MVPAGGAGWELAGQLLSEQPKKRPSAASARSHAWFRVQLDPSIGPSPQEEDNSVRAKEQSSVRARRCQPQASKCQRPPPPEGTRCTVASLCARSKGLGRVG